MTSLVQISHPDHGRRVALVAGDQLRVLDGVDSVYALALRAIEKNVGLKTLLAGASFGDSLDYDAVHQGRSDWFLLAPADHPFSPASLLVTGTGLTHRASADNRQAMHLNTGQVTDSMRMYQWGVEGGKPDAGAVGASPEWFYKGTGESLRGHHQPLAVPDFAEDGGEEGEIAGVYLIDPEGTPRRIGMAQGNEFSDHVFEKRNYLYLASSKLRHCSIGPELILDPEFSAVPGTARVLRGDAVIWEKAIRSGEENMCHSLANIEHHHFKFPGHRMPGDLHVHFYGASAFSFGDGVRLKDGDVMEVAYGNFGRPLRNPISIHAGPERVVTVVPL
ncbi:MAG: GguC protein [Bryobacterales bacterium]|nr:GguC protein [Bryobacterales bacterium]